MNQEDLLAALDALWGCCEQLYAVCAEMVSAKDARIEVAGEALTHAQERIAEMQKIARLPGAALAARAADEEGSDR